MSNHTPGPWEKYDNDGYSPWSIWSKMTPSGSGTPGPKIANVWGDSAEADANAHLIAAAPDLLEACLFALQCTNGGEFTMDGPHGRRTVSMGHMLKAAIAKAEGKQ